MPTNRQLLIAIALACFAMIGVALYLQHVKEMLPCPRCVIQRYAFIAAGVFALIGAFSRKPWTWTGVAFIVTLLGSMNAFTLVHVINNPGFTCGIDPVETFLNKIPTATYLPGLFRADGLCEAAGDQLFIGQPVPYWSALATVMLCVVLGWMMYRLRRTK